MTYDLKLPNPEENRATLALFWETAQPLKHVVAELPDIGDGPKLNIKPVFPLSALVPGATIVDLLNSSVSSEVEFVFRNLPEPLFERLALRFRPFYANDEEVNLLKLLNFVSQLNPDLHQWKKERKKSWDRAVFWGAMGMPEQTPPVKAEDVIRAGLYSKYFHLNRVHREKALAYEKSLGAGMYRIALVSSVWQRANVVLLVANEMEQLLVDLGIVTEEAVEGAKTPPVQLEEIALKVKGGPGAFRAEEIVKS
jgi:hypothetical protein